MSHYTVLVAIDPTDPKRPDVETALAPFDEGLEVEPYRVYEEGEPTDYWLYTHLKRQAQHVVDGTGILPYEPDGFGWSSESSKKTVHQQRAEMQADADAFHALHGAEPVSWADIVKLRNERYGDESPSEVLHLSEDGRAYTISTYNPDRFGLVHLDHGKGSQADQSAGAEVLFEVRGNQGAGGVSEGGAFERWSIHLLFPVHEGAECGADAGTPSPLAHSTEVRDQRSGVRADAGPTATLLRDLPGPSEAIHDGGRSLPLHGGSSGLALSAMQHGSRLASGFSVRAGSSDELPAAPAGYCWALIGGSKWDWYQIGGRWTGWFYCRPEYTGHPDLIAGEPGTMTEPNYNRAKCDGGPKYMLDFDATRKMAEAEELGRHIEFCKLVEGLPEATLWSVFVERHKADPERYTIEQARADYHGQPRVLALKGTDFQYWNDPFERFQRPREEVLARAAVRAVPGFATLTLEGEWREPGQMGWFGMSTDTPETQDAYYAWANEYVDSLGDDIVLVLVDVHI